MCWRSSCGTYSKVDRRGKEALCAQDYFMEYAKKLAKPEEETANNRVFIPAEPLQD